MHGAFVNTDGFTVGAATELSAAFEIVRRLRSSTLGVPIPLLILSAFSYLSQWEIAQYHKVRHFVWSNLDYALRLGVSLSRSKVQVGCHASAHSSSRNMIHSTRWITTTPKGDSLIISRLNRIRSTRPTEQHGRSLRRDHTWTCTFRFLMLRSYTCDGTSETNEHGRLKSWRFRTTVYSCDPRPSSANPTSLSLHILTLASTALDSSAHEHS